MTQFVNNVKTTMLLAALIGLAMLVGYAFGGVTGLFIGFLFGGAANLVAFFFSDKIAIAAMKGVEVNEQTAPDLVTMVARLARNAGLPMPRVYICPQQAPNAFATGRSPKKAAVAVTRGALELLSYEELEGVMAHELAHVKNRDTLISTVAAVVAGAITVLAHWGFLIGGMGGGNRDNPFGIVGVLLMVILAPIAAGLIQMAISRSREYVADADGAAIAGTPDGLISALSKLDSYAKRIPMEGEMPASNHLFIVQPLSAEGFAGLFSTHPPTEARIRKLRTIR